MSNSKKNSKSKDNLKLNILERTLYKRLYSTLEKSLKASYDIYYLAMSNYGYEPIEILTFKEFCELVDKKLKGEE